VGGYLGWAHFFSSAGGFFHCIVGADEAFGAHIYVLGDWKQLGHLNGPGGRAFALYGLSIKGCNVRRCIFFHGIGTHLCM